MLDFIKKMFLMPQPATEQGYFSEAKAWHTERYEMMESSRNYFRLASCVLLGLNALLLASVIVILPLKSVQYRVIEVNKQTGEVSPLNNVEGKPYSADWTTDRFFISQYVLYRESYNYQDIRRAFNQVLATSDRKIGEMYSHEIVSDNPKSPINTLKDNFYRETNVKSINRLNNNTALVRYQIITHNKMNLNEDKTEEFQAVIKWEYGKPSEILENRDKNPLGFFVTYYQPSPVFAAN
jgi:type IV secretion system protein VirB8